jgi:hypothetical protein
MKDKRDFARISSGTCNICYRMIENMCGKIFLLKSESERKVN